MLATSVLSLSSSDNTDNSEILNLIEILLDDNNEQSFSFDAEVKIKINKEYLREAGIISDVDEQLDAIPNELVFKIDGKVADWRNYKGIGGGGQRACIYVSLVEVDGESCNFSVYIDKWDNRWDVSVGGYLRDIILDLLCATGFLDTTVKNLFNQELANAFMYMYKNVPYLRFRLANFDLSYFDKYMDDINKIFTFESTVNYDLLESDYIFPYYIYMAYYADFSTIKANIDKELRKMPGYRYSEMLIVLNVDEDDGESYINILATRENGEKEVLDPVKLDVDLSPILENLYVLTSENIIPMRYFFELFGETVDWDYEEKAASIVRDGKNIYFDKNLINSKTYISASQIRVKTDYRLIDINSDECIEIMIGRK